MADGDIPQLNAPPDQADSQISVSPIVPDQQQQTPSAATSPPAAQQKDQQQDPTKAENVYINKMIDSYNDQRKRDAEYMNQSQSTWSAFQKKLSEMQTTPAPKLQQIPPAPTKKDQLNWGTAIGDVLSMVAIASTIFGKHRGGYSQAIQTSAVAAFVNGYQQGKEGIAKNALEQWKEQTSMIQKNNEAQIQQYKETLADKRLTLSEQMDVIKAQAESVKDQRTASAAEQKDLAGIIKAIHDQTQAQLVYRKQQADVTKHLTSSFLKMPGAAAWRSEVMSKYGIDPSKSDEDFKKAEEKYPLDQFNKDFKGGTVEEHEDDILGLKSDKKPTEEDANKIFSDIGLQ